MSKEKVRHFYNSLAKESDLQKRLQERSARFAEELKRDVPEEERMEAFFLDAMLPVVREAGFDFSYADLKEYGEETSAGELADEQRGKVDQSAGESAPPHEVTGENEKRDREQRKAVHAVGHALGNRVAGVAAVGEDRQKRRDSDGDGHGRVHQQQDDKRKDKNEDDADHGLSPPISFAHRAGRQAF